VRGQPLPHYLWRGRRIASDRTRACSFLTDATEGNQRIPIQ
jgi:hypothetical protein